MSQSWLTKYDNIINLYLNKKKYNEENKWINYITKPEITENDLLNEFIQTGINLKKKC